LGDSTALPKCFRPCSVSKFGAFELATELHKGTTMRYAAVDAEVIAPEIIGNLSTPRASSALEIRLLEPGEEDEADRFVQRCSAGTFFHLSGWKRVIEGVLKRRCYWLTARRDNAICGVFPICQVRNSIFGDCLVSLPLTVYGGICTEDRDVYFQLLAAGQGLAAKLGAKYLEMRNRTEPCETGLPGRDLYVTFTLDLTPGPEKLLKNLPRDTRYAIRKSQRAGLAWTEDLTDRDFYEIYAQSVHRLGTPVFSRELFLALRREFPTSCRLFGVRKGNAAIAGVLCFYFRNQVLPYYGGSIAESHGDCPNNFMYWSLIEQSSREGCRGFDFGRSKKGTGSFDFKSAWSMQVEQLPYRYQLVKAKEIPHLSPVDAKFQLPIAVWKKLPLSWTKIIGPMVIRSIPSI
jgi:FemAB-related protein (PEP-CTERM system-associated)